jgi:hypothetical protein
MCRVTETGFGLVIGFINHSQVVTTNNYNTVPDLHNLQSLHYNLLSLFPLVFTIGFLATDLNTGIITDSHFKYHCTKSLLITINIALPLFLHFIYFSPHWLYSPRGPWPLFSLLIHSQLVGLLGRVISPSQGRYLNTGQHKQRINTYTTH